jgi:hypothetical protein
MQHMLLLHTTHTTLQQLNRASFVGPFYTWQPADANGAATPQHACRTGNGVLLPMLPCLLRRVTLWHDYYLRWSPKPSFPGVPRHLHEVSTY